MTEKQISELSKDLTEIELLLQKTTRQRVAETLNLQKNVVVKEISELKDLLAKEKLKPETETVVAPRYTVDLKNYAWDQSDKFLKVFVTLEGADNIEVPNENVNVQFTENSLLLKVIDVANKDYSFVINNFLEAIVPENSYWKCKKNMIRIFVKKSKEGSKWSHVTITEKRVKESKKPNFDNDLGVGESSDPSAGLMNVLKTMYDSGDPEMKRMINKAMHENQNKTPTMPF